MSGEPVTELAAPPLRSDKMRWGWKLATVGAVVAVGLQCWGLYRVTGPPVPLWFPNADKVEHAGGFALTVVMILLSLWLRARSVGRPLRRPAVVVVVGLSLLHAVVSELVQHFFYRTRTGDPWDAVADSVGVGLGLGLFLLVRRRHRRASR